MDLDYYNNPLGKKKENKENYFTKVEFFENEINPGISSNQEQEEALLRNKELPEQQPFWQKYV